MIIKCNVAGSLHLSNLDFSIQGGSIIDLSTIFKEEIIKRELTPPSGCIYQALCKNWIRKIDPDSLEYKNYAKQLQSNLENQIKKDIKENARKLLINYYKKVKSQKIEFIKSLDYSYYDFILDLSNKENDNNILYALQKKLGEFAERKIQEGFILI